MASTPKLPDLEQFRLRRFLESLPSEEFERREGVTDLADVAAHSGRQSQGGDCSQPGRRANPLVRQRGRQPRAAGPRFRHDAGQAAGNRLRPPAQQGRNRRGRTRAEAPVQQVVLTGDDCRPHRAAGASAARRGRRALYLGLDRLRRRSGNRLDQRRRAPPDAARPHATPASTWSRRATCARSTSATPSAASACRSLSWSARIRSIISRATMRLPSDELALISALRGAPLPRGQVRHQRPARAGRRRMGARGLSRRARPRRAGRPLWRVPRLLRRA